ncbi:MULTISPECIES: hypothetical protein [Polyangium]|uniref:Fibronectin type III domain-containing protein n=2 Tax=Polyangium TaxID=55 RepID=A0A4V5PNE9_9BACT|nr:MULTISPECIES: hypothetical protein [Polyangium]MDI1435265.1 hypothetical protein [Polyangium sorediatum]TKD12031.1 hypothetical protein E8A74_05290 [Polyangium fumosum]
MKRLASSFSCVLVLLAGACASEVDPADSEPTGYAAGGPSWSGPLEAPVLEDVIPMSKVLRVRWSLVSPCEEVEAERRTDAETFALAFTAEGTDTDHVDEGANEDQAYTYRLRCVRGEETSAFSNTLSANPFSE